MLPKSNGQDFFGCLIKSATQIVRQVKHFALRIENRPGLPAAIASALWQKGINIETFSAELHRGQGTFHLVVDKVAVAKETFIENGWEAAEEKAPALKPA